MDAQDETEAQLRAVVRRQAAAEGVDADLIVRSDEARHELSDVAARVKADEVVVGSSASVGHRIAGALGIRLIRGPPLAGHRGALSSLSHLKVPHWNAAAAGTEVL